MVRCDKDQAQEGNGRVMKQTAKQKTGDNPAISCHTNDGDDVDDDCGTKIQQNYTTFITTLISSEESLYIT